MRNFRSFTSPTRYFCGFSSSAQQTSPSNSSTKDLRQSSEDITIMSYVHLLSSGETQKELTEAVKETQGSKRMASWKSSARPCWWINEHSVTLRDGTTVSTGTFDAAGRRKWRKSHFQAALFLYHQWVQAESKTAKSKGDSKIEEENTREPGKPSRAKMEAEILPAPEPRKRNRTKGKRQVAVENPDAGQTASSMEKGQSPPMVLRKRKAVQGRKIQKTSPQIHIPVAKRQLKDDTAQNGKTLARTAAKIELQKQATPQSHGIAETHPDSGAAPSRLSDSASDSSCEIMPIRRRRRAKVSAQVTSPTVQDNGRMPSPVSGIGTRRSLSLDSPIRGKRLISEAEAETRTEHFRTPLQERNVPSNLQDKRPRKKRNRMISDDVPSDKENQTPPPPAQSILTRLRSAGCKNGEAGASQVDPTEIENRKDDNRNKEHEVFCGSAVQRRKEKDNKFLRDQIAKVKAERDRQLEIIDHHYAELEERSNNEMRTIADNLRMEYRWKKLRFSKQIVDMPVSKFVNEHGGNIDEWMIHDTEVGVNKTFEALHNGEDPNNRVMSPSKTPTAMSRRAALTKTARKTRRKVAGETAVAGLSVRRSQRTAAKVATKRTRDMIASTPRTEKKEVTVQVNSHAASGRVASGVRPVAVTGNEAVVCSRLQLESLGRSIRQQKDPVEAFRKFTSQLQREALRNMSGGDEN